MTESPQAICAQIRRVLSQTEGVSQDELVDLMQRYRRLVLMVNKRLDRANAWLRQGLRTEALGLVEQQPDAIDAAAELCLAYSWHEWAALCNRNGMDTVPCPDIETAGDLSDAYDREELVEEHLAKHRLLALANGPLAQRVAVVRGLALLDPDNPIWRNQQSQWESHRITQMSREALAAASAKDLPTLRELLRELTAHEWLSAPPQELNASVAKAVRHLQRAEVVATYETLASQLHEAHGAQDDAWLDRLVAQWENVKVRTGVAPPETLVADVASALFAWREWEATRLADVQFRGDLALMEELLDAHATTSELEPLYEKLRRAEREVPRSVSARYESRRDEHRLQRRFRMRLITGSTVGVIIVIGATLAWWISEHNRERVLDTWVTQIDVALKGEDILKTRQLLDELQKNQPLLWNEASITAQRAEYDRLVGQDSARQTMLLDLVQELEEADPLDLDIDKKLKTVQSLALSEEERHSVAKLRDRILRARRDDQFRLDGAFRRVLAKLNDEYRRVLGLRIPDAERIPQLEELATQYGVAIRDAGASAEFTTAAKEQLQTLRNDLTERKHDVKRAREVALALAEMRNGYQDLASYRRSAEGFIDAFPERPESRSFQIVMKNASAWEYIERWNELVQSWNGRLTVSDVETAARFGGGVADLPAELNALIGEDMRSSLSTYFSHATAALDRADSGIARLGRLFEQPWMSDLRYVSCRGGERYYVLYGKIKEFSKPPPTYTLTGVVLSREALVDSASRTRKVVVIDAVPKLVRAAHCLFAEEATEALNSLGSGDWRTIHLRLAKRVVAYTDIDPLLRLELVRILLNWHQREGWPSTARSEGIARFLAQIEQTEFGDRALDEVSWPDMNSPVVEKARGDALSLLGEVPDFEQLVAESDTAFRELERYARVWRPVGLAWRNGDGEPDTAGSIPEGPVGIVRVDASGNAQYVRSGEMGKDGVLISRGRLPEFGSPLFRPLFRSSR